MSAVDIGEVILLVVVLIGGVGGFLYVVLQEDD